MMLVQDIMSRRLIGSLLALLVVVLTPPGLAAQENTLAEGKKLFTQQGCYGCHMAFASIP